MRTNLYRALGVDPFVRHDPARGIVFVEPLEDDGIPWRAWRVRHQAPYGGEVWESDHDFHSAHEATCAARVLAEALDAEVAE